MSIQKAMKSAALALGMVGTASAAYALTFQDTDVNVVAGYTAQLTGGDANNEDVYVDPVAFTLTDKSIIYGVCVDLWHNQPVGPQNETRTYGLLSTNFSGSYGAGNPLTMSQIGEIGGLVEYINADLTSNNPDYLAAAAGQADVWSLLGGSVTLNAGAPTKAEFAIDEANGFAYALSYKTPSVTVVNDFAQGHQSFAVEAPEPATWALMLLGLGGVGAAMRRNQKTLTAG